MQIESLTLKKAKSSEVSGVILGIQENQKDLKSYRDLLDPNLLKKVERFISREGFRVKKGDILNFDIEDTGLKKLYVVVLSKESSLEEVRQVCGRLVDVVSAHGYGVAQILLDSFLKSKTDAVELVEAMSEAIHLSFYRFDRFKPQENSRKLTSCQLLSRSKENISTFRKAIETGRIIAESVNFTRDLVNTPANELPPRILADRASKMAHECKILFRAYDKKELQKMKMGGILSVSQGSTEEPRLIVLEYGDRKAPVDFVFVGKGVTFDSGGISIKPSDGMEKMKYDMAGGAAVIGILKAVSQLGLKKHIVGIVPAAENLPSGSAYRPGDVIWMGSGKSVEVLNTDAEGRLLLGDALFYAQRYKPKAVVDLATLTGACVVALGHAAIGLLGNDEKLIQKIKAAGETSGERVWELPLWDEYFDQIKSDVAEIKNVGGRGAGTITAAMFLKQFVNYAWAHLDIAGTAWADEKRPYCPKGSTGVGVRLVTKMLRVK
jgi:leucyl aminopeptidase